MFNCPNIPEEAYSAFSKRVHQNVYEKRIPIVGALELTWRCNLRCIHCYLSSPKSTSELSTDEYIRIIDQLAEAGTMWLLITGGEPLLRADFKEIYLHIKKRGIFPTLFTNATFITPELAAFLAEWRPFSVEVSLYGATRKTYEKITGIPGAYDRCLRGIKLLTRHGIKPQLKTMVMQENIHELKQMHDLAAGLDLGFRFDALLNPTLGGGLEPTEHRLDPEVVVELDKRYRDRAAGWAEFLEKFGQAKPSQTLFSCGAGINNFHIDPEGRLCACLLARGEHYDLRHGSFQDGWDGPIREFRMRRAPKLYACGSCTLRSLCGRCPGWAALETGKPEGSVDYLCRVAALRALEFGDTAVRQAGQALLKSLEGAPSAHQALAEISPP